MFGHNGHAFSADGNTALIGAWNDDNVLPGNDHYSGKGAAWVFTRSGSTWTQQGEKLIGWGETGEGKFGTSVALSADGDTALIGGWNDNSSKGAAWVFTRTGEVWTQQGEKLIGGGEAGEGRFGVSVALSADGDTALIPADSTTTAPGGGGVGLVLRARGPPGLSRAKSSPAGARPEKANSAQTSRSPPTVARG